jgi:hypothetical protein
MILDYNKIYTSICLSILDKCDPHKKKIGRPNKYEYSFYLKYILIILINGLSWFNLGLIISLNVDFIRKKYNKWCKLGIFTKANNIILNQYNKIHNNKELFIDSTNIANSSGTLEFGYNIKIKNKKTIKISAIIDKNKVPHFIELSKGSIHDAKIMETMIDTKITKFNKTIKLIGDKGYIKDKDYIEKIKNDKNMILITPNRINSKIKTDIKYKEELKTRYKVERVK